MGKGLKPMSTTKKNAIPRFIAIICSLVMLLCLIIPYLSANESYQSRLERYEEELIAETRLTASSMSNMSLLTFIEFCKYAAKTSSSMAGFDVFVMITIGILGLLILLTILCAALGKAKPTIVFTVLSFLAYLLNNWVFTTMGMVPTNLNWSFGYYLFIIGTIGALAGAIWLAIVHKKQTSEINNF